jgi:hypothetical protein
MLANPEIVENIRGHIRNGETREERVETAIECAGGRLVGGYRGASGSNTREDAEWVAGKLRRVLALGPVNARVDVLDTRKVGARDDGFPFVVRVDGRYFLLTDSLVEFPDQVSHP